MSADQAIAFALFSLVMAATPGPSNTLLTATGSQVGLRRGLPAVLGVSVAMGLMMLGVTLGLGSLLAQTPVLLVAMRWAGAAVLLWFAYQIARSQPHAPSTPSQPDHAPEDSMRGRRPRAVGFAGAGAFQLVNPKSWLACASAAAAFGTPQSPAEAPLRAATLAAIFVAVALPSCTLWLAGGAIVQQALRTPAAQRIFNLTMAALLLLSVALIFFV